MIIFNPSIFQLKWALSDKLLNASPADVGGIGAALRLVLTHKSLRDKFTGVNRDLEEAGFRSIQVTDTGFRLIRDWDTGLNQEMAFGSEEDIDDALDITDDSLAFIRHLYQTPTSPGHREAVQDTTANRKKKKANKLIDY